MLKYQSEWNPVISLKHVVRRTPACGMSALLVLILCGCAGTPAVASSAEPVASMLDMHLVAVIDDVQTLALAIQLADSNSANNKSLSDLLSNMLGNKLDDITHFLPRTENEEIESLACRVVKRATKDIHAATDSCASTELCEKAYYAAQVCVAKGHASDEEIEIPQDD